MADKKTTSKTTVKKTAVKKAAVKKAAVKKPVAKKAAPAKAAPKKAAPKTAPKAAPKKAAQSATAAANAFEFRTPTQLNIAAMMKERDKSKAPKTGNKVTFRIQRALRDTPTGELKTWFEDFSVPYDASTTVLQGLEWIKGQKDGSLTFRRSCRASICGSCGMFINNRSRLACKTKITEILNGNPAKNLPASDMLMISPQKNQPIEKDLVIKLGNFFSKVEKISPYVQAGAETEKHVTKTSFEQVNLVSNCIMCGLCYSDCTAMVENPNFIGPAALAKAFRFVSDPREGHKTNRLQKLSEKDGIWDCTRCGMCLDACPKGVDPMEAIVKLRTRAMKAGVTDNAGARHAMAFKSDIARWGLLNEPLLLLKTLGLNVFGQMGNALHLLKAYKVPSPIPHKAEGLDEIRKIYAELAKNPIDVETRAEDSGPGAG